MAVFPPFAGPSLYESYRQLQNAANCAHKQQAMNAALQQQQSLAYMQGLQGMGNASAYQSLGSQLGMSMGGLSAIYGSSSFYPRSSNEQHAVPKNDDAGRAASGRDQTRDAKEKALAEKISSVFDRPRFPLPQGGLTLENSPLFGRPAFGRFYNWSFDFPFARQIERLQWLLWRWVRR